MRTIISLCLLLLLLAHCNQKTAVNKPETAEADLKNEVINLVKNYADEQLENAKTSMDVRGIITMADHQKKIVINPKMIFTGLIDQDNEPDAIASVLIHFQDGTLIDEHLILLNKNGCLEPDTSLNMNIQIIRLENRKIIADYHTKSRNNPLYNCHTCTHRVTYTYSDKTLVETKKPG